MKRIIILGATGSIGQQALDCLEDCELVGFSYYSNIELAKQIKQRFPNTKIYSPLYPENSDVNNYEQLLDLCAPNLVLNCIVGFEGIYLTQLVIQKDMDLALANKESLVVGGYLLLDLLKQHPKVHLYPVDSEHSSLYQLFETDPTKINKIYITASGGPFYSLTEQESYNKTFDQAIKHPKWNMGYKISIDSATLVNKCFELIEAFYLFENVEIKALYHPQSIVHSLVQFEDNGIFANMSTPDMKIAINLALHDFKKQKPVIKPLSFDNLTLHFEEINPTRWLPIAWAYELMQTKNMTIGVIINLVNDYAIEEFKKGNIRFGDITRLINEYVMRYKHYFIKSWRDLENLKQLIMSNLHTK